MWRYFIRRRVMKKAASEAAPKFPPLWAGKLLMISDYSLPSGQGSRQQTRSRYAA